MSNEHWQHWLESTRQRLEAIATTAGRSFHAGLQHLRQQAARLPYHIDAYRGMVGDDGRCTLAGRVLERPIGAEPRITDDWWDNLLNSYRRFDAESMPGVKVDISFRGTTVTATTDAEGYYQADFAPPAKATEAKDLWQTAEVRRSEGGPVFLQSVLCVPDTAKFGLISDIDDTVLQSNVSHWQAALQHTFLSHARTRKPLEGVGQLYTSFQKGQDGKGANPIFYVSASPWNVYDLLVDFMALNGLPDGPILLRDVDFDTASFLHNAGPHSKLAKIHQIIDRYPTLQWVLVGDSGQIDAQLYAQTVVKYPGRVLAVYIRDIDPTAASARDKFVDTHIQQIASSKVPMLRVADGTQIAEHARKLGLIAPEQVEEVAKDAARDQARPDAKQAVAQAVAKQGPEAVKAVSAAVATPPPTH